MSDLEDGPATLSDEEVKTHRLDTSPDAAVDDGDDTGDDSGDAADTSDTSDTGDVTDTGDDSGDDA